MTLAGEDPPDQEPLLGLDSQDQLTDAKRKALMQEIQKRLIKLNQLVCHKISSNFNSVNKAFLTLD